MIAENLKFLRKFKNLTQGEMLEFIGLKANTLWSDYERGKSTPQLEFLLLISDKFKISLDDLTKTDLANTNILQNDEDSKKADNTNKNTNNYTNNSLLKGVKEGSEQYSNSMMPKVVTMDTQGNENVVFVPVKARAGYLNGYGDEEFISTLPAYRLPGLGNGTFRLFEVGGLSMHPTLNDKDMVIGSFVESFAAVRDDRVYVVVTKSEGIVVKRCLNRFQTDDKLILKSDNYKHRDDYPTIVCNPEDILEIWYVTGFMSRQLRPPAEMYTRLIDLEARLTLTEEKLKKQLP